MTDFIDEVYAILMANEVLKKRFLEIATDKRITQEHKRRFLKELLAAVHDDSILDCLIARAEKEVL